jgi:hypothetical protein
MNNNHLSEAYIIKRCNDIINIYKEKKDCELWNISICHYNGIKSIDGINDVFVLWDNRTNAINQEILLKVINFDHKREPVFSTLIFDYYEGQNTFEVFPINDKEDQLLQCKSCNNWFILTKGEIEWYKQKNLNNPKRCKRCRVSRRNQKSYQNYTETLDCFDTSCSYCDDHYYSCDDCPKYIDCMRGDFDPSEEE